MTPETVIDPDAQLDELTKCAGVGRNVLEARIAVLVVMLKKARLVAQDYNAMLTNLTSVQARCTELLLEVRALRAGIVLPGWTCRKCGGFTGTAKEDHQQCRACGEKRPE
jgi:rubrerythrin